SVAFLPGNTIEEVYAYADQHRSELSKIHGSDQVNSALDRIADKSPRVVAYSDAAKKASGQMGGTASGSPKYSMVGAGLVGLGGLDAGFGLGGILGELFGGGSNSGQSSFNDLPSFSTDLPSIGNDRSWYDRAWNDLVSLWDSFFASDNSAGDKKPSLKSYGKKEANRQAQANGYKGAEALKEDYVQKHGAEFDMKHDTKTGEIWLENKTGTVQKRTGLYHQ
ncbi:MAG: hypothetical protein LBV74_00260, partial [Tannerella sp.]|nr:hypothetical protein [Tannerella sp.]